MEGLLGMNHLPLISKEAKYYFQSNFLLFAAGIIGTTPVTKIAVLKLKAGKKVEYFIDVLEPLLVIGGMAIVTAYLVDGSFNPFLYFRF